MPRVRLFIFLPSLFISLLFFFSPGTIDAGLPLPPPPPLLFPAPPPVVLIPGTSAYFAPDIEEDLIFYHGYWYRPYGGRWFISAHYGGPWGYVSVRRVPSVLINLPPGYRSVPPGRQRIPYGQLKKNWKTWEGERHWDKPNRQARRTGKDVKHRESPEHGFGRGHGR